MSIRRILHLALVITLALTISLLVVTFRSSSEIEKRLDDARLASELARATSQLALLTEEYVAYKLPRIETQWRSKVADAQQLLTRDVAPDLMPRLRRDLGVLDEAFAALRQTTERHAQAVGSGDARKTNRLAALKVRRATRLRLLYSELSRFAFQVAIRARRAASDIQRRNTTFVVAYALLLAGVLGTGTIVMVRSINTKLAALGGRARAIGGGDLATDIPKLGDDAFGVLAGELGRMAGALKAHAQTEARQTEALRESEARFRNFAETAADYFWEVDETLRFTRVEGRFEAVTGVAADTALGQPIEEFWTKATFADIGAPDLSDCLRKRQAFEDVEYQWAHPAGFLRVLSTSGMPFFDAHGDFAGFRGSGRDVSEKHDLASELSYHASHDALTGLINRREFEIRLHALLTSAREADAVHTLCYLDLDQFKVINDTCGHVAGDELLRQASREIGAQLRKNDTLARIGGDEFAILMEHCGVDNAERVAEAVRRAMDLHRFVWEGNTFSLGVSIGIAEIASDSGDYLSVLSAADSACYAAKEGGRNRTIVYRENDATLSRRYGEMRQVARINNALDSGHFRLMYQNIRRTTASAETGAHYEILLRMQRDDGRLASPSEFLSAAERYDLSTKIDCWVVEHTFSWLARNPRHLANLYLCGINLSGRSLGDREFLHFVRAQFERTGIAPSKICFEVTETAAISNLTLALDLMRTLGSLGCKFALDDFGSGLSSFAYLKNLPVDFLKIDGAFVKDVTNNPVSLAMVRSIHEIGHVMGKQTIAEFVSDAQIAEKMSALGVDFIQGHHIGMPHLLEQFEHRDAAVKSSS